MGARDDIADQVLLLWLHRIFREGSYLAEASSFMQDGSYLGQSRSSWCHMARFCEGWLGWLVFSISLRLLSCLC